MGRAGQLATVELQQAARQKQLDADREHIHADYLHVEANEIRLLFQQRKLDAASQQLQAGWMQLAASRRQAEAANAAELANIQTARDALAAERATWEQQQAKLSSLSAKYNLTLWQLPSRCILQSHAAGHCLLPMLIQKSHQKQSLSCHSFCVA